LSAAINKKPMIAIIEICNNPFILTPIYCYKI
jgi:hypothetical protein